MFFNGWRRRDAICAAVGGLLLTIGVGCGSSHGVDDQALPVSYYDGPGYYDPSFPYYWDLRGDHWRDDHDEHWRRGDWRDRPIASLPDHGDGGGHGDGGVHAEPAGHSISANGAGADGGRHH